MSGRYRSAVAAYVRGHDRVWEISRMRGESLPEEPGAVEWSAPRAAPRFGVGVASSLQFHRGPGNLRPAGRERGTDSHD
ncbi:MAG: hypothetical protein ACC682_03440 [Gemmatimonadota bacterium]